MNKEEEKRMWRNLLKGAALLAGGFMVVLAIDYAMRLGVNLQSGAADYEGESDWDEAEPFGYGGGFAKRESLLAAALDDDYAGFEMKESVPPDFITECFSPATLGDVRYSEGESVVGIMSDERAEDLQRMCSEALQAHGWACIDGGDGLRSSYVKDGGRYRWLFLGCTPLESSSCAVIVLQEEAA